MQRRTCLHWLAAAAALPALVRAAPTPPPEVLAAWPQARLQGSGRLRYFGLHVYDARLWVAGEPSAVAQGDFASQPLALELAYARALDGVKIAERSLEEMARAGALAPAQAEAWLSFMKGAFPDVQAGDRITGIQRPGEGLRFFVNGRPGRELRDAEFARRFIGIWLGPSTSEPALRRALLGLA